MTDAQHSLPLTLVHRLYVCLCVCEVAKAVNSGGLRIVWPCVLMPPSIPLSPCCITGVRQAIWEVYLYTTLELPPEECSQLRVSFNASIYMHKYIYANLAQSGLITCIASAEPQPRPPIWSSCLFESKAPSGNATAFKLIQFSSPL